MRSKESNVLQGFVTWTTFTTWQNHFRWDSLTDTADIEHNQGRTVDADGSIAKRLSNEVYEGDPEEGTLCIVCITPVSPKMVPNIVL